MVRDWARGSGSDGLIPREVMTAAPPENGANRALEPRRASSLCAFYGTGCGIPMMVGGGLLLWLGTLGYPAFWVLGVALLVVGLRGVFVAVAGGVRIDANTVDIRGWVRRKHVDRGTVRAVGTSRQWAGCVRGWLDTPDGRIPLSCLTIIHNHVSAEKCPVCAEASTALELLAQDLKLPYIRA